MAGHDSMDVGHVVGRLLAVTLPIGLTLDEVIIQAEEVRLSTGPFEFFLPSPGSLEIRVSEASLATFLEHRTPAGLSDFSIRLLDGLIHVGARATMIISLSVGAVCSLRIEDGARLFVDLVRMESIGGTGARNLVQRQLDAINPVLDASELPVDARMDSVEIEEGWLVLRGTIGPR